MIEPEIREAFERVGLDVVKLDIGIGRTIIRNDHVKAQALEWVAEQERKKANRERLGFWVTLIVAVIAAVAAVVAAWPIVFPKS